MFNVFLDSDGVIADFDKALYATNLDEDEFKHRAGTYLWLPVMAGAEEALVILKTLDEKGDIKVWVVTKTPSGCPYAYTEKVLWYRQHFPWLEDRIILTHDKSLIGTENDFLVDDRPEKGNVKNFRGTFYQFFPNTPVSCWQYFLHQVKNKIQVDSDVI